MFPPPLFIILSHNSNIVLPLLHFFQVIVYLMNLLRKHLNKSSLAEKLIEEIDTKDSDNISRSSSSFSNFSSSSKPINSFSSQYGHTSSEVIKASYRTISNKVLAT